MNLKNRIRNNNVCFVKLILLKKKQMIINGKFRNIEKLEHEKNFAEFFWFDFIFLIDIVFEQFFFVNWGNWSILPDGTVAKKKIKF